MAVILALWMWACSPAVTVDPTHRPGTATGTSLAFEGIDQASWDGADGLSASWGAATSGEPVQYTLEVRRDGLVVDTVTTEDLEAPVVGLGDGEYRLRVIAESGQATPQGGHQTLDLLIGDNRLVFRSNAFFTDAADVWGEGDIVVATARHEASLLVYDTSDPLQPVLLKRIEEMGYTKDVKIGDGLLFVQGECGCAGIEGGGQDYDKVAIRIFDFADPANPVLLSEISEEPKSVHNLSYGAHTLFASDNTSKDLLVFDVTDPYVPVQLESWTPPEGIVHDQTWIDGLVYVAAWRGFAILDATDPENLSELLWVDGLQNVHNIWPSDDGSLVFVTHETQAGGLTIWDVSDPEAVTQVATYDPYAWTSVHNVQVRGDVAYLSYYQAGVEVLDVSDPRMPTRIGWFDTWGFEDHPAEESHPHETTLYSGAWGIWPHGEHVVATDTGHGLFVLDYMPATVFRDRPDSTDSGSAL
jgi:hypothetical protein